MQFHEACSSLEAAGFKFHSLNGRAWNFFAPDAPRKIAVSKIMKTSAASLFAVFSTVHEIPEFYAVPADAIRAARGC